MKRKKILVIDDSEFMRMIIKKALENKEFDIIEADNGKEGVKKFKSENPDIVTTDLAMPDMDGFETLRKILEINKHAKVIVCSSMTYQETVDEVLQIGAVEFVLKPFKDEDLVATIKKYI